MKLIDVFITLIFICKLFFIGSDVLLGIIRIKGNHSQYKPLLINIKRRTEMGFKLGMAVLMIILFNPRQTQPIVFTFETKLLFYLFGFVTIITTLFPT